MTVDTIDDLIDLLLGQALTCFQQHFTEVFFTFKPAGVPDVPEWSCAVDQQLLVRPKDGVKRNTVVLASR